jgi:hypothetical protein
MPISHLPLIAQANKHDDADNGPKRGGHAHGDVLVGVELAAGTVDS